MKIFIILISIVLLLGCQTTGRKTSNDTPTWVTGEPKIEGMICVVGASEPAFYREDAKQYAAENARKELARTITVDIRTIMVEMSSQKGSSVDEATVMQASSWATSTALENSKIMEYWFDENGQVSKKKNITYALSCMPRKFNRNSLEKKLASSRDPNNINLEEISLTATEIIKHLEEKK